MPAFVVLDAASDKELGRASLYDGVLETSGLAEELIGGRVHNGESEADAFRFYADGWSNAYILTRPEG